LSQAPETCAFMHYNVARFDFLSMRLAIHCAEEGSLSAAARLVHCSLPTASQRLTALESALGRKLFCRDHRGVHLTAQGELFVKHARRILSHLDELGKEFGPAVR